MNRFLTIFAPLVSVIFQVTASVGYGDEIQDEPSVRIEVHGVVYETVLDSDRIMKTGKIVDGGSPIGIGLLAAAEKAKRAFENFKIPSEAGWVLHSAQRQFWLRREVYYAIIFRERTSLGPAIHGGEFPIFVLLDGTVLPTTIEGQKPNKPRHSSPDRTETK